MQLFATTSAPSDLICAPVPLWTAGTISTWRVSGPMSGKSKVVTFGRAAPTVRFAASVNPNRDCPEAYETFFYWHLSVVHSESLIVYHYCICLIRKRYITSCSWTIATTPTTTSLEESAESNISGALQICQLKW